MAAPIVVIGGIYLVNSNGTPTAGGVATAAATTPFAIRRNWRPMPADPIVIPGAQTTYPNIHYEPVADPPIPISVVGSSHENAVARLQELQRAIMPATGDPAQLEIQPTSSSTVMQAEIVSGFVRLVQENESGFEGWEGFTELHAEIVYIRSAFFTRKLLDDPVVIVSGASFTNTGTGTPDDLEAFSTGLDGDLANEGQPTWMSFRPTSSGANTIIYAASVYSRTYSTTGSGAKTTSSTTGASSALNTVTLTGAQQRLGLKARVLFRFTNNTSNVQVRVEMRANTGGTVLYAGPWVTPTASSATLYDMGRVPFDHWRMIHGLTTAQVQLYIGYRSTDGSSATATLGYNECLLYYDFCRIDCPTAVNSASGSTGYRLETYAFLYKDVAGGNRPLLPLDAPIAVIYDITASTIIDIAYIRGRLPRAIEGGSLYLAWMTAGNVHSTSATATVSLHHSPLWRTLRGSD